MLIDLDGQVKEAFNMTERGKVKIGIIDGESTYIRILINAYKKEICNNFKDKGVNHFKGETFPNIRDQISDLFDSMPPPKQDITYNYRNQRSGGGGSDTTNNNSHIISQYLIIVVVVVV